MDAKSGQEARKNPEQGVMIGLALVVIFAILIASGAFVGKVRPPAPRNQTLTDFHNGVVFQVSHPKDLRIVFTPLVRQHFDPAGKPRPGRTRWYQVFRGNVVVGDLEVLVPPPEVLPPHGIHDDQVFIVSDDGRAAFRFVPEVPRDGESLSLFERILDAVQIQGSD